MSRQPIAFDYKSIEDTEQRKEVTDHTKKIYAHLERSSLAVVDIGRRLIAVHEMLGMNIFWTWVEAEFQWSRGTASEYMSASRIFGKVDCLKMFNATALYELARQKVPDNAVEDAIAYAETGVRITKAKAKEIIAKYVVAEPSASSQPGEQPATQSRAPQGIVYLKQSLDQLRTCMSEISNRLSPDERKSLADDLIEVAMQLRGVQSADEVEKSADAPEDDAGVSIPKKKPRAATRKTARKRTAATTSTKG